MGLAAAEHQQLELHDEARVGAHLEARRVLVQLGRDHLDERVLVPQPHPLRVVGERGRAVDELHEALDHAVVVAGHGVGQLGAVVGAQRRRDRGARGPVADRGDELGSGWS
ncbi:MAG: hypothetical protein BGO37_16110 [Cellulomonas sp. 73-92]|nr:MAG: hypothetical protein BGO37_16110 [Cellulomonas sp. 73-92]